MFRAFDLGITHFDLANNYGTPPGNAEIVCGKIVKDMPRDELIISSKAGYRMWPGPYGEWGSRKYLIASCDQSLKRTGLEYFDIFYSHRPDPETPFEETLGALDTLVKQGKALYVGVSSYSGAQTNAALAVVERERLAPDHDPPALLQHARARDRDGPAAAHGPRGRGRDRLLPARLGAALGHEVPGRRRAGGLAARAASGRAHWVASKSKDEKKRILQGLNGLARERGQTLAQMAVAWTLRHAGMTSRRHGRFARRAGRAERGGARQARLHEGRARAHRRAHGLAGGTGPFSKERKC